LPDADDPGFVALNGSFQAEHRSLIGQMLSFGYLESPPRSGRLLRRVPG
jgi:hypothetical protein